MTSAGSCSRGCSAPAGRPAVRELARHASCRSSSNASARSTRGQADATLPVDQDAARWGLMPPARYGHILSISFEQRLRARASPAWASMPAPPFWRYPRRDGPAARPRLGRRGRSQEAAKVAKPSKPAPGRPWPRQVQVRPVHRLQEARRTPHPRRLAQARGPSARRPAAPPEQAPGQKAESSDAPPRRRASPRAPVVPVTPRALAAALQAARSAAPPRPASSRP